MVGVRHLLLDLEIAAGAKALDDERRRNLSGGVDVTVAWKVARSSTKMLRGSIAAPTTTTA